MLLQQSVEHVSIVYTCITYFEMHRSNVMYLGVSCHWSHIIKTHTSDLKSSGILIRYSI